MARKRQHFEISSGDDLSLKVILLGDRGEPITLVNPSALWIASKNEEPAADEILISKTSGNSQISFVTEDGQSYAVVDIFSIDTENMEPGTYFHTLRLWTDGKGQTVAIGNMKVLGSVNVDYTGDPPPGMTTAYSLQIGTVDTGAAGTDAAATISGGAPRQQLNLVIPKGDKGDPGIWTDAEIIPAAADIAIPLPDYFRTLERATPEQIISHCGDDSTDATAAILKLATHPGVVRLNGIYRINTATVLDTLGAIPTHWEIDRGAGLRFNLASGSVALKLGSDTRQSATSVALTADAGKDTGVLRLSSNAGIVKGTSLRIVSDAVFERRAGSKIGQWVVVDGVDANTGHINLAWALKHDFLVTDNARVFIISPMIRPTLDGLSLFGNEGTLGSPVYLQGLIAQYCVAPNIADPYVTGFSTQAINLQDCLAPVVHSPKTEITIPNPNLAYHVGAMGITEGARVTGHTAIGGRHATTTGNTNIEGRQGIVGVYTYKDAQIYNTQSSGDAIDTHAGCLKFIGKNIDVYGSAEFALNIECTSAEIDGVRAHDSANTSLELNNYTDRDGDYVVRNVESVGSPNYALYVGQHPAITGKPPATGRILSLTVEGLRGRNYAQALLYFKNYGRNSADTVIKLSGLVGDASDSINTAGQVYLEPCRHVIMEPVDIQNVPYNGIGVRILDAKQISGSDLGTVTFRAGPSGQAPTGIGFYLNTESETAVSLFARLYGKVIAGAGNSARVFYVHPNITTGLTLEAAIGDASQSGIPSASVEDPPAVYEGRTMSSGAITLTRTVQEHWVQVAPETGNDGTLKQITAAPGTVRGKTIYLTSASGSYNITIDHAGTGGNLFLRSSRDQLLGLQYLTLIYDGTSKFYEQSLTLAPNSVAAITTSQTLPVLTIPNHAVEITTGNTALALELPASSLLGDELDICKVDTGTGIASITVATVAIANLYAAGDCIVVRWTGSAWRVVRVAIAPRVEMIEATATWNKDPLAKLVLAKLQAPGGGAGSGRRGAAGSNAFGGGPGSPGGFIEAIYAASAVPSSLTVTIGLPGSGGAAVTTDDTNGNPGTAGGNVSFGSLLSVSGGPAGGAGTTTGGAAGSNRAKSGMGPIGVGATTSGTPGSPTTGFSGVGGPGGSISSANTAFAGGPVFNNAGNSSIAGGAVDADGVDGVDTSTAALTGGVAGSGGGASLTGAGRRGGNGGKYGAGSGGGGASRNGNNSGKGGDGGPGCVQVITYF